MRSPQEALAEILGRVRELSQPESVPLSEALGRVLSRDVRSDIDLPPFEKSAMDGFAVRSTDFERDGAAAKELELIGESRAGAPFTGAVKNGECVAIFTGAEVPESCDAVVMVEKSEVVEDGARVRLTDRPAAGQHVCHRGEDLRDGVTVFERGRPLGAVDLAVLASVGCDPVPVLRRPRVALCTTGDELVPPHAKPAAGEIREGNTYYLAARLAELGAVVTNFGVVRDDADALALRFSEAIAAHDVLVTTGGVSMGKYDLVGAVLEHLGVEPVLHRVAIKPGKPIWFGVKGSTLVFGLPGNPVSCLIGLEVFVRPALAKLRGEAERGRGSSLRVGRWLGGTTHTNPRQQNVPVRVVAADDGVDRLEPVAWSSSADIVGLARADGLVVIEPQRTLELGDLAHYRPLE